MAHNFITNKEAQKTLKGRLNHIIPVSEELKFLVGFFYFSGWKEVYERIKENPSLKIKLLIGLQVDKVLNSVVEHGKQEESLSQEDIFQQFLMSMGKAINNEELDNEAFYNQVSFFLELLEKGNLQIRKTLDPNHAKLYLFKYNEQEKLKNDSPGEIITGSSNLTKAGLGGQSEFNVEIRDYGFEEAEAFFDDLWDSAVPISEVDERKRLLVNFIRYKSQAASVSPFEAYVLILKTYLDLQAQNQVKPDIENLLEDNGFEKYSYQLDAVNQALSIIKEYNGAIIADVVGLGKSVIAALIAKSLGKRGIVICPPGLMGDRNENTGWHEYLNRFGLWNWEVHSRGKLEDLATSLKKDSRGIEMVIVDEAHYFKNQDTEAYEQLLNVCRGKTVLLLTATPFSNTPADIFSLLKLFIIPGRSGITIEDNMEATFRAYEYRFKNLSYITKNYKSTDPKKRKKAESYYVKFFGLQPPVDITLVKNETRELADNIKSIIAPVVIRRNRLDLKTDHQYSKEIKALSEVDDPKELFFSLSEKQSEFYDKVINSYFGENGVFTGAIYQPFVYEKVIEDEENLDEAGNRAFQQQRNLFDFMRRLLVKRFESSFGAFYE
ncbi:MAG: SNF2-related protein, partial [Bacteroidota bacterium]